MVEEEVANVEEVGKKETEERGQSIQTSSKNHMIFWDKVCEWPRFANGKAFKTH